MQKAGGSGFGGATYALKGDGAAVYGTWDTEIVLAAADTGYIDFANTKDYTTPASADFILVDSGAAGLNRGYITARALDNTFFYNAAVYSGVTLDGVAVVNDVTPFPTDGLEHRIAFTCSATCAIGTMFARYTAATTYFEGAFKEFGIVKSGVPQAWRFNSLSLTTQNDTVGGSPISLFGVAAEDWVTLPL
jgi:hypothetical protein